MNKNDIRSLISLLMFLGLISGALFLFVYHPLDNFVKQITPPPHMMIKEGINFSSKEVIDKIEIIKQELEEKEKCYNNGTFFNKSYDLIKDYNLTCKKLEYLNEHFVLKSTQHDGGDISGSYSGFLSHGSIDGKFYDWSSEQQLTTGNLIKHLEYHLDCQNSTFNYNIDFIQHCKSFNYLSDYCYDSLTVAYPRIRDDTKIVLYYTIEDFINYYTNKCIKE